MRSDDTAPSLLLVWTDVDPLHEDDFNRWYDEEHVVERVAVPGIYAGSRYRARGSGRRYLGLYWAEHLDVFRSCAYRRAFQYQSDWSIANLERMRNPMRRVCGIAAQYRWGIGAWLAVARLGRPSEDAELRELHGLTGSVQSMPGVVSAHLIVPDHELSASLPAESTVDRVLDPIILVETSSETAADAAARFVKDNGMSGETATLQLLWHLAA